MTRHTHLKAAIAVATIALCLSAGAALAQDGDPFMGDWEGKFTPAARGAKIVAQVIALGKGAYQINLLPEFDKRCPPIAVIEAKEVDGKIAFEASGISGVIEGDRITGTRKAKKPQTFEMMKIVRPSPTLGAKPPTGAIVLFDGTSTDGWVISGGKNAGKPAGWQLVDGGAMEVVPKTGSIISKRTFGDVKAHVEFRTPFMPEARGQGRGNSGVYLQGRFEVQVLDSYGLPGYYNECGGIYKVSGPNVNMCAPPLQWQTYDITFHTGVTGDDGKKVSDPRITVLHNGVMIQKDTVLPGTTQGGGRAGATLQTPAGIHLQDHGNKVQYRNIWVVELDK